MNSRRRFFGQIATIIAAAPSILVPKFNDRFVWKYGGIPEVRLQLKREPIVAKVRRLKVVWTVDLEQDIQAYHSISAEKQLEAELRSRSIDRNYLIF